MPSSTRTSISALPRGHAFTPQVFALDIGTVRAYLDAVGDANDYGSSIPPLAAVALGLSALQSQIALPDGALHTGQEVEQAGTIDAADELTLSGRIAQRSERQGFVISVIEFEISHADSVAIRARTTIMAPGSSA